MRAARTSGTGSWLKREREFDDRSHYEEARSDEERALPHVLVVRKKRNDVLRKDVGEYQRACGDADYLWPSCRNVWQAAGGISDDFRERILGVCDGRARA